MQTNNSPPQADAHSLPTPRNAALYVYVSWKTRDGRPLLADDQIRQAASQAVTTRTRTQLCRLLAIAGTACELHAVFRFPASLQISSLARVAMQASADAVARLHVTLYGCEMPAETVWERHFQSQTLNETDAAQASEYLRGQVWPKPAEEADAAGQGTLFD